MKQLCLEKIIRLRIRSLIRNKNNKLVSFETYLKRKEIIIRLQIRSLIIIKYETKIINWCRLKNLLETETYFFLLFLFSGGNRIYSWRVMQKRFDTRYIMDILETKFRCAIYGGLMLLKVRICMAVSRGSIFRSSLSLYVSRFTSNLFRNAYRHLS